MTFSGYFTILQVVNRFISFLSSSIIVLANLGGDGLSTPFRRIVYGLSISDALQSLAFITGPVSVPRNEITISLDTEGYYVYHEYKNSQSCRANGFILEVGIPSVIMYTVHLSLYYLYKLKYRMARFHCRAKYRDGHLGSCVGVILYIYHSFCSSACWGEEYYDNARWHHFVIFLSLTDIIFPAICLLSIIIMNGLLCHHVVVQLNKTRTRGSWSNSVEAHHRH